MVALAGYFEFDGFFRALLCAAQTLWNCASLPANIEQRRCIWFSVLFEMEAETLRMRIG